MRKIGLDFGTRSLGIAISDPMNIIAMGLENCRFDEMNFNEYTNKVKKYINEFEVDKIIMGYPLYLDGNESPISRKVKEFKSFLETELKLEIVLVDESFTSKNAHEIMIKANVSRKKRKLKKDKIAAQLILQSYLNRL